MGEELFQATSIEGTIVAVEDGVPGCPVWFDRPRSGWRRCGFAVMGDCPVHGSFTVTTYREWVTTKC